VVCVEREVDRHSGMAIDFGDLKRIVRAEVVDILDHKYVNDVIDNPTAELMAVWIWNRLRDGLPGLVEIELHETASCSVVYRGE
jgi:6-pyruvoyltetrahydropterin/6-carboxytetrahydropterin synthase